MGFRRILLAVSVTALLSGCSSVIDPSKNQVENFSGVVPVGGQKIFFFSWGKQGEIEVTMTSVSPTPTNGPLAMFIGLADNAQNCGALSGYAAQAIVNRKVQFGVLDKGSYCLGVYDPGALTVSANIAGTFSHP